MHASTYIYNLGLKFSKVVEQYATRTALRYPDGQVLTYRELDKLANQLTHLLRENDIVQGNVVAIFNEKSPVAYALMLACIKSGVVYSNLDVSSPFQRISKILDTCQPKAVFLDNSIVSYFPELDEPGLPYLKVHLGGIDPDAYPTTPAVLLDQNFHGDNPLYIMFTSGSTGFPKGAVMSHNNILNFIEWGRTTFGVNEKDVFTNANPIYFDNSVFDFYVSLFNGAALVPLGHELVKQPRTLVQAINESGCSVWFSVPSLLVYLLTTKALSASDFPSITRISFGGEGFPKNKLKKLFEMFGHRMDLFNVYGPTECTCICSSYKISEQDFENMNELAPLGWMAPNFGYHIIPQSETNPNLGELCLTGPCVGLGYYNDPERTAASFVQHPVKSYHQRMYRTGDLVEKTFNGYLYFRGRADNQVKHMGYRIELEEIEAAFSSLPEVDEVGVTYEKLSAELGQIKAYVAVQNISITADQLHHKIKEILPPYMLPRIIRILEVLPKNQNGKIDRKQLTELS